MNAFDEAKRHAELVARARAQKVEPWQLKMAQAVGNSLIADIVRDNRIPPNQQGRGFVATEQKRQATTHGSGLREARPLPSAPPGARYIDMMMDAEDAAWRAKRRAAFANCAPKKKEGEP